MRRHILAESTLGLLITVGASWAGVFAQAPNTTTRVTGLVGCIGGSS